MNVFSLFGRIVLDDDEYRSGLSQAETATKRSGRNMQRDWDRTLRNMEKRIDRFGQRTRQFGQTLTTRVTAPMAAAGAAALVAADRFAQAADRVDKGSQAAGLSAERYQTLRFAFDQAGISAESFDLALGSLNRRLGLAAQGNKTYADAFSNLGVQIRDAGGQVRATEDIFDDLIGSLQDVPSAAEQAALASIVFGDDVGKRLLPIINQGVDGLAELEEKAREAGLVMSTEAVEGLVEYKDEMAAVRTQLVTAGVEITSRFLPVLKRVTRFIREEVVPWMGRLADRVEGLINWFSGLSTGTQRWLGIVAGFSAALGPALIVLGTMASAVSKLIGLYRTLRFAMLPFLGPAGIAAVLATALGVTLVGALRDTSDATQDAIDKAGEMGDALGRAGEAGSLSGAVTALAGDVEGPGAEAWGTFATAVEEGARRAQEAGTSINDTNKADSIRSAVEDLAEFMSDEDASGLKEWADNALMRVDSVGEGIRQVYEFARERAVSGATAELDAERATLRAQLSDFTQEEQQAVLRERELVQEIERAYQELDRAEREGNEARANELAEQIERLYQMQDEAESRTIELLGGARAQQLHVLFNELVNINEKIGEAARQARSSIPPPPEFERTGGAAGTGVPGAAGGGAGAGGGGGGPPTAEVKVVADAESVDELFRIIEERGTDAVRRALATGLEARGIEERIQIFEDALQRAYELGIPEEKVDFILQRLGELRQELEDVRSEVALDIDPRARAGIPVDELRPDPYRTGGDAARIGRSREARRAQDLARQQEQMAQDLEANAQATREARMEVLNWNEGLEAWSRHARELQSDRAEEAAQLRELQERTRERTQALEARNRIEQSHEVVAAQNRRIDRERAAEEARAEAAERSLERIEAREREATQQRIGFIDDMTMRFGQSMEDISRAGRDAAQEARRQADREQASREARDRIARSHGQVGVSSDVRANQEVMRFGQTLESLNRMGRAAANVETNLIGFAEWLTRIGEDRSNLENLLAAVSRVAINAFPDLEAALRGFKVETNEAGEKIGISFDPMTAFANVLGSLLSRSEGFANLMETLSGVLDPVVKMLDQLFTALQPLAEVVVKLIEIALKPLAIIIENVVAPVFRFVAEAIRRIYNFLLGWAFGRIESAEERERRERAESAEEAREGRIPDRPEGAQRGSLEFAQWQLSRLQAKRNQATSSEERARLNRQIENQRRVVEQLQNEGLPQDERPGRGSIAELERQRTIAQDRFRTATTDAERQRWQQRIDSLEDQLSEARGEEGETGPPPGSIAAMEEERQRLQQEFETATSDSERTALREEIEELGEEIQRMREGETEEAQRRDAREGFEEVDFTGSPQSIQFAVATPLKDAATIFHDAVMRFTGGDTMGQAFPSEAVLADFSLALQDATPVLDELARRGGGDDDRPTLRNPFLGMEL